MRTSECVEKTTATTTTLFDGGSGDKYDVEEEGGETDRVFAPLNVAASNEALCTHPTRWRDRKKEEVERKVRVFVYSRFVI